MLQRDYIGAMLNLARILKLKFGKKSDLAIFLPRNLIYRDLRV